MTSQLYSRVVKVLIFFEEIEKFFGFMLLAYDGLLFVFRWKGEFFTGNGFAWLAKWDFLHETGFARLAK